jgi:putative MATE family efflux protein
MALPIAIGMMVQTLYFLVDLYFVGKLGKLQLAGVSTANSVLFLSFALTQVLNVGIAALVSQAIGKKDYQQANHLFNQSMYLSIIIALVTLFLGYGFSAWYMHTLSQDLMVAGFGTEYLYWFIPGLIAQVLTTSFAANLRAAGIVKPAMTVQLLSVIFNMVLSPILIHGYIFGVAMGVAGASFASSLSAILALFMLWFLFKRADTCFVWSFKQHVIDSKTWKKIFIVGLPAGGEFILLFVYMALIYWCIQGFGSTAHAGFGVGVRVMQTLFLPAMALSFALPAIVGQNYGAQQFDRVKQAFVKTAVFGTVLMMSLTIVCKFYAPTLVSFFTSDDLVAEVGGIFLLTVSWNFIPSALIFACSGVFQGFGNTWPSLLASASRLVTFAIPAIWLSLQPDFELQYLWNLSVVTVFFQCALCCGLLFWQMRSRLRTAKSA